MEQNRTAHLLQVHTEDGWRDLKPFIDQESADLACEQLTNLSEAHNDGREYRVLSWLPNLTVSQLAEGDECEERR
jgi:hypothetical protein